MQDLNQRTTSFRTICRDCIFAEFTEDCLTQTGCSLGRLNKFIDKDLASPIEDDETGVEYYEIQTFCNTCRDENWARGRDNPQQDIINEIALQIDGIVLSDSQHKNWEEETLTSVKSIVNQTHRPKKLIIGFYRKKQPLINFLSALKALCEPKKLMYEVVNILEYMPNEISMLDHLVKKAAGQYFTVCEFGEELPLTYFESLNRFVNQNLNKFSMINPIDGLTGLTIQRQLFNLVNGSINDSVMTKIKELAKTQNAKHMVLNWSEL
jgi:hypothetical protein